MAQYTTGSALSDCGFLYNAKDMGLAFSAKPWVSVIIIFAMEVLDQKRPHSLQKGKV